MTKQPFHSPLDTPTRPESTIAVMGLGGAGCNTIHRLFNSGISNVKFVAANTDIQSMQAVMAHEKIFLGKNLTRGLGAGGDDQIGRKAAEENFREIIASLRGSEVVFLTAGMGGGTGSGAIEIAARIARSLDIRTISVVTLPFSFESGQRTMRAREAVLRLQSFTDTLITIPNDKLIEIANIEMPLKTAFAISDDYLIKSIQAITSLIQANGLINVDISHVLRALDQTGGSYISIGYGNNKNRSIKAIHSALNHPLIEKVSLQNAKFVILKLTGNLSLEEIRFAMQYMKKTLPENAELIPSFEPSDERDEQVQAIVLATGVGAFSVPELHEEFKGQRISKEEPRLEEAEGREIFHYVPADGDGLDFDIPAFIRKGYNLQVNQVH